METDATDGVRSTLEKFDGDLPESIDRAALDRMQTVAHALDKGIRVPGTEFRFGLDPIAGILPGAGDSAAAVVSLYIVAESARMGVSRSTLLRMLAVVAVDAVGGSVPVLGVIFDAFWKANTRNLSLALQDLSE
ncbi:DUF4112 domain-containing protein [Natrinema caseinilyticum]|uniref:DUF4112 domain-containing protein n=1 Tax=Natrinema caseinilyticum TaxID=2961570 RepID=UPI0020C45D51|nr:DUF4112 domain-containing protein [Natrinema caseinilyticum]